MTTILNVKEVAKKYGDFYALNHITFTVQKGEFVGIMGPSGAGKSTLLNVLATIDTPTNGEININGTNTVHMKEEELANFRRDHLGFIFQDYNLLDSLTVRENIILPLAVAKRSASDMKERVEAIADVFGIRDLLDKYPYQISGGQKQRTASARALIAEPTLLFADEPTGALDSKSATDLLETLSRLNAEQASTILMVTHDAYAASFCHRILFIQDGELSKQLLKGQQTRKQFFQQILDVLATFGGGAHDAI